MRSIIVTCRKCKQRIPSGPDFPHCPCTRPQPSTEPVAWIYERLIQYSRTHGMLTDEDRAFFAQTASALEAARREDQDRIAALEADKARLMGLVKVLQPYLVVLAEKPQKANWTDRYCDARDQLEVVASDILAKIKETPDD